MELRIVDFDTNRSTVIKHVCISIRSRMAFHIYACFLTSSYSFPEPYYTFASSSPKSGQSVLSPICLNLLVLEFSSSSASSFGSRRQLLRMGRIRTKSGTID